MRNLRFLALCLTLLIPASVLAAPVTDAMLEAPAADHAYTVGTLRVQQYGDHGRALILIPGLEGGSWVWRDVIAHQRGSHVIYAVTLAGFDGVPVPTGTGKLFDRADASLLELITRRHLAKPVLIGHSLGGTLSLRFAGEHPGLIGGVVAVDGLPIFPGLERVGAEQRQAIATQTRDEMAKLDPKQFHAAVLGYMQKIGTLDPDKAVRYAALNARSSAAATAEYMAEDLAGDYRPGLKRVTAPILEISPYNAADFTQPPMKMSEAQKQAYYQSLLANAPHAHVISISPSRHFVMLDQPQKLRSALDGFLSRLP
ncbi:MAG TPA: alpha/beta hydrolase [Gammaproteobacteria bacterium]|nr:alpha/beta hydrolase [Gammaproteobacteria bacterium]